MQYAATTPLEQSYLRESLILRCSQSKTTFVLLTGIFVILLLVVDAPTDALIYWIAPVFVSLLLRHRFSQSIRPDLMSAAPKTLQRYDLILRANSLFNQALVGSGIWTVGNVGNADTLIFVTLVICLFGIGAMTNLAQDYLSFKLSAPILMFQPIVFWMLRGKDGLVVWIPIFTILVLMLRAAKSNEMTFRESIAIRYQNEEILNALQIERHTTLEALSNAEQANKSKMFFMAAASHDLRQPLYAASLLHDTMAKLEASETMQTLLAQQGKTLSLLTSLFDNLLDLSRFEANQISPTLCTFRLDSMLDDLASQYAPECTRKQLQLQVDLLPMEIRTDYQLLYRLLSNLVSNAVRYTDHGYIVVQLIDTIEGATIVIRDTGCGIAPEHQSIVFGEFKQIYRQPRRDSGHGVGLGLAIVKQIANVLDFAINLTSEVGIGSSISVQIPKHARISACNQ